MREWRRDGGMGAMEAWERRRLGAKEARSEGGGSRKYVRERKK